MYKRGKKAGGVLKLFQLNAVFLVNYMNNKQWSNSKSAVQMLRALHSYPKQKYIGLSKELHKYYLLCCKKHERYMPQEQIRNGIEGGLAYLKGELSYSKLMDLNYYVEGEAFNIDYDVRPKIVNLYVNSIASEELPPKEARNLLKDFAYFADWCMLFSSDWPESLPPEQYEKFLCPQILRETINKPFNNL